MSAWEIAADWRGSREPNPGQTQAWPIGELLPTVLARLGVATEGVRGECSVSTRERRRDATGDWQRGSRRERS